MPTSFNDIETEQIGADLSKVVDRVSKQYDQPDIAFQKEATQNAWDIRADKKDGKDWSFQINEYKDNKGMTHILVEDFGTKGMNKERWEGFSSLWRPKKDQDDAGGKGQGKFILMNASQDHVLFVESISDEGYLCKFLQDGKKSGSENLIISDHIIGAKLLKHQGTRIWVYNVRREFLKAIHSKEFTDSIMESWWQVLGPRFSGSITLFDKKIEYKNLPSPLEEINLRENFSITGFGRIKRLHLAYHGEKIPDAFDGIMVQRANMTILKIPFEVHDKDYQGRFSGYIEFDDSLEDALKNIERNDHCSFQYESPWKEIKSIIKDESNSFVSKIVPSKEQRKSINIKNLSEVIQKANQIIDEYCPEVLGGGTAMPPIIPTPKPPIYIKHLVLNKREVKWGDVIKGNCGILNTTNYDKKLLLAIEVKNSGAKILEEEYNVKISGGESKSLRVAEIKLEKEKFDKGKYLIRATLSEQKHDFDTKSASFYLESKREPAKRGFIKEIRFYDLDDPTIRNKPIQGGILIVNFMHKDFNNIWATFEEKVTLQNRQIGFYIMKLCFDEAMRLLLKMRLKDSSSKDIDDVIQEAKNIQDRMYYDIYA